MQKQKISMIFFLFILLFTKSACQAQDKITFQNGFTLITEERKEPPLVYLYLTVKAGSIYEGEYLGTGISHFIEHMVFKGREREEMGAFAKKIASMGGEVNAYTSFDRTVYHILVPSSEWKEATELLFEAIFNPSFDEGDIEKEREVILREMALREDDPNRFLSMHFWRNLFTIHPYHFPIIGERPLFLKLKRDDLVNYHKKMYVPNNIILTVCGDIDEEEIKNYVTAKMKNMTPSPLSPIILPEEPAQLSGKELTLEKDVNMAYLNIGFHIPPFGDENMYALDMLSIILGQGKSSCLYKKLKEEESLVYSISSYSFTPLYEGIFIISAVMEYQNIEKVKEGIFKEIQKIKARSIQQEELDRAKNVLKMQELVNQETLEGRASELTLNYLYTQDLEFTSKYLERINKIRKEDIVKVARKYLTESNSTVVLLRAPKKTEQKEMKSKIVPEVPTKEVFDNGLTLISRKNSTLPIVSITTIIGGGVIIENRDKNGICRIFSSMLLKGTKTYKHEYIIDRIESLGGSISTFSANNSFGIKLTVPSKDIDMALETLADVLLNCDFPKDELKKEKDAQIMQITREKDDIFTYGFKNLRKQFFNTHPYSRSSSGEISTVSSIEREDLLQLKEKLIVGKNTVISISGDFNKNEIEEKIKRLFFSMPIGKRVEGGYEQQHKNKKVDLEGTWNQSVLFIGFPAPSIKKDDFYIMEILNTYLNGQASPLFVSLRDKKALAYSVGTFSLSGWDPGMLVFYISTKKEKLEEVLNEMQEEIKKLKEGDFPEIDIESAKKKLLTQKWENLQDNNSFAFELALAELYGLGYEEPLRLKEKISGITKDDIVKFANEYFDEEKNTILLLKGE
jgi:zinc protease